jgi:hypothetical protein
MGKPRISLARSGPIVTTCTSKKARSTLCVRAAYRAGAPSSTTARQPGQVLHPKQVWRHDLKMERQRPVPSAVLIKLRPDLIKISLGRANGELKARATDDPPITESLGPASVRTEGPPGNSAVKQRPTREAMA